MRKPLPTFAKHPDDKDSTCKKELQQEQAKLISEITQN